MSQTKPSTKRYVVNLLRSVSREDARSVADRLAGDLSLTPEQALKLLTRPPGSLIKPTSQTQAERVAGAFVRAGVAVEVVGADTPPLPRLGDPFSDPSGGPLAEPIAPHPARQRPFGPDLEPPPPVPSDLDPTRPGLGGFSPAPPVVPPAEALAPVEPPTSAVVRESAPDPSPTVASPRAPRRTSLLVRILAAAIVPAGLIGFGALAFLAYGLPRFSENLIDESAKQLAAAISSNVDVNDLSQTRAQFDAIAAGGSVGFVRIEPNTAFVNSTVVAKDPDTERSLQHELESFNASNPGGRQTRFRYTDTRAAAFRQSLAAAANDQDRATTQALLDRAALTENKTTSYLVKTAEVFRRPDGTRALRFLGEGLLSEPNPDPQAVRAQTALYGKKLFTIQVGTVLDDTERYISSQLLLFLSAVAIMILAAVLLAIRIARGVATPILALTQAADRISMGELDTPVEVRSRDELGDLAEALERMRTSLQAALERLRRRR